jgi:hypothetical protein
MNYKVRAIVGLCLILVSLKARAINISIEDGGTVSPDLSRKHLIGGRTYTLTAKPRAGYRFDHWSVADFYYSDHRLEYDSPKLSVTLLNGLLYIKHGTNYDFAGSFETYFTAHFAAKAIVPGTYIGINTDTVTTYTTLRVSADGAFSGKAFFQGQWHPFSGKFSEDGTAHTSVRVGNHKVGFLLTAMYGSVYVDADPAEPDFPWLASVLGPHSPDPRVTTYYGGKYTVTINGEDNDASVPKGDGFATASVDPSGRLHAVGRLADGTPFTQSVLLSVASYVDWPIFVVLKGGTQTLAGTMDFFLVGGALAGSVTWEKSRQTNDLNYPEGFRRELGITGSRYLRPDFQGNQVLQNSNLLVSFDGGTLPIHFAATATLTSDNRIVVDDPTNQIAMAIQFDSGIFSGSATPPGQTNAIQFQGALMQHAAPFGGPLESYYGSGFFLQNNLSGRIKIVAPPPPLETTIISNPTNLYAGYSGGFTGLVSGSPSAYFWDFGDGTIVSNSAWAVHTWTQGGDFDVKLRAVDDANQGGVTATCQVHISVPTLEVSLNETEVSIAPGEAHNFAGQITGLVDWYLWHFSDGYSIAGLPPSDLHSPAFPYSWTSPGDYQVVLSGFNAYLPGGISATSIVHVIASPSINSSR